MNQIYPYKDRLFQVFRSRKRSELFWLGIIILIGISLRLYNLGQRSLWFDEADVVLDSVSIVESLKILRLFNPVIFYKIFIFYWRHISFYMQEWMLRLPSVAFAVAAIFMIYKLALCLSGNKHIAVISSLLLAISPLNIYYSQELVSYSLLSFLTVASVYCFFQLSDKDKVIYACFFVMLNVISIYTHPIMWFILLGENIIFGIKNRHIAARRKIMISNIIIIILCLPWFYPLLIGLDFIFKRGHFCFERASGWIPVPKIENLFYTVKNFASGYTAPRFIYTLSSCTFILLFILGLIKGTKKNMLVSLLFVIFPIAVVLAVSRITHLSYYTDRYLSPLLPFFCVGVATGIYGLNKKSIQLGTVAIIIAISAASLNNYYRDILPDVSKIVGITRKEDIRGAAAYIFSSFQKGDVILHTCRNTALPFEYYLDFYFNKTLDVFQDYPERTKNKQYLLGYFPPDDLALGIYQYRLRSKESMNEYFYLRYPNIAFDRVFLVFSAWNFTGTNKPEIFAVEWVDRNYVRESEKRFKGIIVYIYKKKETAT